VQPMMQWGELSITYSDCVYVALGIPHAMRKRRVIVCGLPALQYFSTSFHKWHDFRKERKKKKIEHKMCVLIFCTTFIGKISHSKKK